MITTASSGHSAPALVVGLCAHGLAIARALARRQICVHALEADRSVPGASTRYATIHWVEDIHGPALLHALRQFAQCCHHTTKIVLFLTNDKMVRTLAEHWHDGLAQHYALSWAAQRHAVLRLLDKSSLQAHCDGLLLPYPGSEVLEHPSDLNDARLQTLQFPLIVKPVQPLSGFKVRLVNDGAALSGLSKRYPQAFPLLLQQWIDGDDSQLYFTAFYLDEGNILRTFEGQKLRSDPPTLGQTSIARPQHNPSAIAIATRFFAPLKLSGPVSLEIKMDITARAWIIEPTIGRTDYWVDCCIANQCDLVYLEYLHQIQALPLSAPISPSSTTDTLSVLWFDTERAPLSYLRLCLHQRRIITTARFPYWGHHDIRPWWRAVRQQIHRLSVRIVQRLRRLF